MPAYEIKKPLLSEDELIAILNLDYDYLFRDKLTALAKEGTQELYMLTGHDFSNDEVISEVAKGAVRDFCELKWYGEDANLRKRYEVEIINLQRLVNLNGEYF